MEKSIKIGDSISITHEVSEKDTASFKGEVVHKVCSTFVLAREMEWSSRQFMFQICDEDEEGVGTSLTIEHKSPAFIGETLTIEATVSKFEGNELICNCIVKVDERVIAYGSTGQKVLKRTKIEKIFSKLGEDE